MHSFQFYIFVMLIFDVLGVVTARLWSLHRNPFHLAMVIIFFSLAGLFFALSMQFKTLAVANIFWTSLSVILTTVVSYFLFKENIAPIQFTGIAIIIVGLALVSVK